MPCAKSMLQGSAKWEVGYLGACYFCSISSTPHCLAVAQEHLLLNPSEQEHGKHMESIKRKG